MIAPRLTLMRRRLTRSVACALALSCLTLAHAGFTKRTLSLPEGVPQSERVYCAVFDRGASAEAPVVLCQFGMAGVGASGFAVWELGSRLRATRGSVGPSNAFMPSGMMKGGGRYTFARLAAGDGPSFVVATPGGVVAHPAAAGGRVIDTATTLDLVDATFPTTEGWGAWLAPMPYGLDLDGDGKDELLLPNAEANGWTAYYGVGRDYSRPVALPASDWGTDFGLYVDSGQAPHGKGLSGARPVRFRQESQQAAWLLDVNSDGLLDSIGLRRDSSSGAASAWRLSVFRQTAVGVFEKTPSQTVIFKDEPKRRLWRDINADGLLDVIEATGQPDMVSPLMLISIYLAPKPHCDLRDSMPTKMFRAVNPEGLAMLGDWDDDGDIDFAHTHMDYTFGSAGDMAEKLFGKEIEVQLKFYAFENGTYPFRPTAAQKYRIKTEALQYFYPRYRSLQPLMAVVDDLTGDGHPELLLRTDLEELDMISLDLSRRSLDSKPKETFPMASSSLPKVNDLDGDGKADLWMFDPQEMAIRVYLQD